MIDFTLDFKLNPGASISVPDIDKVRAEASGHTSLHAALLSDEERLGIKQELYNSYSQEYALRTKGCAALYAKDYDLFATRCNAGKRVLDLGCGPGRDARELSIRGLHVLGVDFSARALLNCEVIETRCLNYETQLHQLAAYSLDGLWTNCSLTTTPRHKIRDILRELGGMLPIGAPAFFGFIEGTSGEGWIAPDWKYHLPRYRFRDSRQGICSLLSSEGFLPQHVNIIPKSLAGKNTYVNVHCINTRLAQADASLLL